jgi:GNAT superfamily N-acetyltransferase
MPLGVRPVELRDIEGLRDIYRQEMHCQVIHDSVHPRPGWSKEYLLILDGTKVGYGSMAVGGPWQASPTLYEFFVLPQHRMQVFALFEGLLRSTKAMAIETQSNDVLLTILLHTFAREVVSESILFQDGLTTAHSPDGAVFRRAGAEDAAQIAQQQLDSEAKWLVSMGDAVAAAGDILFHYNRPYGDIYMKVAEPFRRQGIGTYLVQELKRVCYEGGSIPAARCNPNNLASRKTLQKAGFVPCGHILKGSVSQQLGEGRSPPLTPPASAVSPR